MVFGYIELYRVLQCYVGLCKVIYRLHRVFAQFTSLRVCSVLIDKVDAAIISSGKHNVVWWFQAALSYYRGRNACSWAIDGRSQGVAVALHLLRFNGYCCHHTQTLLKDVCLPFSL